MSDSRQACAAGLQLSFSGRRTAKTYSSLPELLDDFQAALNQAGITAAALDLLPLPSASGKGHVVE